jgi:hypothetical protein
LVTSRNNVVTLDPTAGGRQVTTFTCQQGSAFLFQLLARNEYDPEETASAEALAETLGGFPLALNLMGKHILVRRTSITKFLLNYRKNSLRHHQRPSTGTDMYYNHALDTVWETSFKYLEGSTFEILAVISFIAPDNITEGLFVHLEDMAGKVPCVASFDDSGE